jgi:ferrous iron transport protein A
VAEPSLNSSLSEPVTFVDLRQGVKARVVHVDKEAAFCDRLLELGLLPGTEFTVTKVAPFGDPIEIDLRGYKLCLRRAECCCLRVEILS